MSHLHESAAFVLFVAATCFAGMGTLFLSMLAVLAKDRTLLKTAGFCGFLFVFMVVLIAAVEAVANGF